MYHAEKKGRRPGWILPALLALALGQVLGLWTRTPEKETPPPREETVACLVTGTVIRQETVICAPSEGDWRQQLENGRRAAAGELLFVRGETRRPEVEAALPGSSLSARPLPERKAALLEAVSGYNRGLTSAAALSGSMLAWSGGEEDAPSAGQPPLIPAETVCAPESGLFYAAADGLEDILTPAHPYTDAADLPQKPVSPLALGRLITSDTWYFSAFVPCALREGDTLEAELLGGGFGRCTMTVEEFQPAAGGGQALLSCRERLEAVAGIRTITVKMSQN